MTSTQCNPDYLIKRRPYTIWYIYDNLYIYINHCSRRIYPLFPRRPLSIIPYGEVEEMCRRRARRGPILAQNSIFKVLTGRDEEHWGNVEG